MLFSSLNQVRWSNRETILLYKTNLILSEGFAFLMIFKCFVYLNIN